MDLHSRSARFEEQDRVEGFVQLFTADEARLRAFVMALVPRSSDADDIMQRVSLVLWKKFELFQAGTSFLSWGCQIARLEVKKFFAQRQRDQIVFSDRFIDEVARQAESMSGQSNDRRAALEKCLKRLPLDQRRLIGMRYEDGASIESMALQLKETAASIYKKLSRIRHRLFACIINRMASERS